MQRLGVDTSKVIIIAPQEGVPLYAEDIFERLEWWFKQAQPGGTLDGRLGVVGIDSIGGLVSKTAAEQDWSKAGQFGGNSKIITRFINNVVGSGLVFSSKSLLLMLNQVRDDVNNAYNQYIFPGGRALSHACAQILSVTRSLGDDFKNPEYNSRSDNQTAAAYLGQRIRFKTEKTKVGGSMGAVASVNYYYADGLDILQNMVDMGKMYGIVEGTTWLSLIDPNTGEIVLKAQGMKKFKEELSLDMQLYKKFDYLLTYTMRGMQVKSVVDEWDEIHLEVFGEPVPAVEPDDLPKTEDEEETE